MIESEVATLTLCNNNFSDVGTWTVFHGHPLRVCAFHSGQKVFFLNHMRVSVEILSQWLETSVICWVQFWIVWLLGKEAYKLVFCGDSGFRE